MSQATETSAPAKAILTDVTKCIGCERCVEACTRQNKLPQEIPAHHRANDGLSSRRYTSIVRIPGKRDGTWRHVRRQCMHCNDPSCASACLVSAFEKTADGSVTYDASKCIGCRYCMLACPFSIPRYEYDQLLPIVQKCKMNEECRVEGGMPACTSTCPTGATTFGPRDKMIAEARRRIKENPDLYIDHIYGEYELGGTSVIYISDVPLGEPLKIPSEQELERIRLPQLAKMSIPELVHNWVLVTPFQFLTVASGMTGAWFLRRRAKLMEAREARKANRLAATNGDGNGDQG